MKRIFLIAMAVVLALGAAVVCFKRYHANQQTSSVAPQSSIPLVRVEPVRKERLSRVVALTGSIEPTKVARMASPAEGPIVQCQVREGDRVKAGDLVVRVGRKHAAESAGAAAQEELSKQTSEVQRVERLVKSGAIPGEQLDIARAELKKAEAQLAAAQTSTRDYNVVGPWDGVVSRVWIAEGNYVSPRAPLVEIFDPGSLVLRFGVPEADSAQMRSGMKLDAVLDAYPGRTFTGKVVRVYPELDRRMRTRTLEAELISAPPLIPGMFARVRVFLETVPDALTVPSQAIVVTPKGQPVVFVVKDGKADQRNVQLGFETEGRTQILSGVRSGENVVTAGMEKLRPGKPVRLPRPEAKPDRPPRATDSSASSSPTSAPPSQP